MSKKIKLISLFALAFVLILSTYKVEADYTPPQKGDEIMRDDLSVDFTLHILDENGEAVENFEVRINNEKYSNQNNQGTLKHESIDIELLKPTHHHIIKSVYYVVGNEDFEKKTDYGIKNVKDDIVITLTIQKDKQVDENINFMVGQYDAHFYINHGSGKVTVYLNDIVIETHEFHVNRETRFTTHLKDKIKENDTFTVMIDDSEKVSIRAKNNTSHNRFIRPTIGDKVLIGQGVSGWTLKVYRNDDSPIEVKINDKGRWLIELETPLLREENIYFEFLNEENFVWEAGNFKVERPLNESRPTVNLIQVGDKIISGKATDSKFVDLFISNHSYYRSFVDEEGNWIIKLDAKLKENEVIYLYSYDDIEERTLMWESKVASIIIEEPPPTDDDQIPPIIEDDTVPPIVDEETTPPQVEEGLPTIDESPIELENPEKDEIIENVEVSEEKEVSTNKGSSQETLPQTGASDYRIIALLFMVLAIILRLKYRETIK